MQKGSGQDRQCIERVNPFKVIASFKNIKERNDGITNLVQLMHKLLRSW